MIRSLTDGEQLLSAAPGYSAEELRHLARNEQVVHLDDMLLRRTAIAFTGGMTAETLKQVASAIADPLGWDADRVDSEIARATQLLHDSHRVLLGSPGVADIGNPEQ